MAVTGVFKPVIYKGKYCYAPRKRTICKLADGTSAFEDELPKGAKVIARRTVEIRDGEMLGVYKQDTRAIFKLLRALLPEKYGVRRGVRKR